MGRGRESPDTHQTTNRYEERRVVARLQHGRYGAHMVSRVVRVSQIVARVSRVVAMVNTRGLLWYARGLLG